MGLVARRQPPKQRKPLVSRREYQRSEVRSGEARGRAPRTAQTVFRPATARRTPSGTQTARARLRHRACVSCVTAQGTPALQPAAGLRSQQGRTARTSWSDFVFCRSTSTILANFSLASTWRQSEQVSTVYQPTQRQPFSARAPAWGQSATPRRTRGRAHLDLLLLEYGGVAGRPEPDNHCTASHPGSARQAGRLQRVPRQPVHHWPRRSGGQRIAPCWLELEAMRQTHVACHAGSALASLWNRQQATPLPLVSCLAQPGCRGRAACTGSCHRVRCRCKGL